VWEFGDGSTSTESSTTHTYSTTGQKEISVRVENTRGVETSKTIEILIINPSPSSDATYGFAIIDSPQEGQVINTNNVNFEASSSYFIKVSSSAGNSITCLAGECPSETSDGTSISGSPASIDNVDYKWELPKINYVKTSQGTAGVSFSKNFADAGAYIVKLTITLSGTSSSTANGFSLVFSNPVCVMQSGQSYWVEAGGIVNSLNSCERANGRKP
jgi:PKD repeat protein